MLYKRFYCFHIIEEHQHEVWKWVAMMSSWIVKWEALGGFRLYVEIYTMTNQNLFSFCHCTFAGLDMAEEMKRFAMFEADANHLLSLTSRLTMSIMLRRRGEKIIVEFICIIISENIVSERGCVCARVRPWEFHGHFPYSDRRLSNRT